MALGMNNSYSLETKKIQSEQRALIWVMDNMLHHGDCQYFETDCKYITSMIQEPKAWSSWMALMLFLIKKVIYLILFINMETFIIIYIHIIKP